MGLIHQCVQQDLVDWKVANFVDSNTEHHNPYERQSPTIPKLLHYQPDQSCKQTYAECHFEQTKATGTRDYSRTTCWFSEGKEHHQVDLKSVHSLWETSITPEGILPCLWLLQKAFDRVLQVALWARMKKFNTSWKVIYTIQQLHVKDTITVFAKGTIGEWFHTLVRICQDVFCHLHCPTFSWIFPLTTTEIQYM